MFDFKNLLFIDIETVAQKEVLEENNERLIELWNKKASSFSDIETLTPADLYKEKAGIFAEFGKIITIAIGFYHFTESQNLAFKVKAIKNHDERLLLQDFSNLLEKFNQNKLILVAHNGKEFDFPYLCRRFLINKIKLPEVLNISNKKPWEIKHIDTLEFWKFGDRKSYTSLELLATVFNIPTSKDDIDGSQVNGIYYSTKNIDRIALYCQKDVIVTARLYLYLNTLPYELLDEYIEFK